MEKKLFKKAIVETVGPYMYIDTHTGFVIEENRPMVAQVTPYLSQKIADGLITLLVPNLPFEADDKDFAEYYASFKDVDGGTQSAVASYVSKFEVVNAESKVIEPVVVPNYKDEEKTEEELMAELEAEEAAAKLLAAEEAKKLPEPKEAKAGLFNKKAK